MCCAGSDGDATDLRLRGRPDIASFLRWDLSSTIPAGQVVDSARITLNVTMASSDTFDLFQMLVPWVESETTFSEFAAGGQRLGTSTPLTAEALSPLVEEAEKRLIGAAAPQDRSAIEAVLQDVMVEIADLSGAVLGRAAEGAIQIDVDAAGYGWFIDSTPTDDDEFGPTKRADAGSAAHGRFDLLSVIAHELGHILGREHTDGGLMDETLSTGERRLPSAVAAHAEAHDSPPGRSAIDDFFAAAIHSQEKSGMLPFV